MYAMLWDPQKSWSPHIKGDIYVLSFIVYPCVNGDVCFILLLLTSVKFACL